MPRLLLPSPPPPPPPVASLSARFLLRHVDSVAALLIAAHVVFEGRDHRLVLHLRVEVTSLRTSLFTFGFEPPPADLEAPTTVVTAFLLDGVASVLEGVDPGTWSLLARGTVPFAGL